MPLNRLASRALTAILALGALFAAPAHARPPHAHNHLNSKPTIVLVHGAWADSGSWDPVIRRLQRDGHTVYAPPNPLMGLDNDATTIADFIHTISGPIVLVGHSYGGAVITNAATGDQQVKALVYVDAYVPDKGDTLVGLTGKGSCFAVPDLNKVFNFVPLPGAASGVVDAYVKQAVFPHCFANGLPAWEGKALAATQRPLATNALKEPSGPPAWKSIPSWDVIGTADHIIPRTDQLAMAKRAHAHVTEINAPHLSMISDPKAVTNVIERAASSAG